MCVCVFLAPPKSYNPRLTTKNVLSMTFPRAFYSTPTLVDTTSYLPPQPGPELHHARGPSSGSSLQAPEADKPGLTSRRPRSPHGFSVLLAVRAPPSLRLGLPWYAGAIVVAVRVCCWLPFGCVLGCRSGVVLVAVRVKVFCAVGVHYLGHCCSFSTDICVWSWLSGVRSWFGRLLRFRVRCVSCPYSPTSCF